MTGTVETDLKLGNLIIPTGAGRGIAQTIDIIDNGVLRRTVNGNLIDVTRNQNRKFQSKVTTTDQKTPTFAGLWKGQQLVVECVPIIRQLIDPPTPQEDDLLTEADEPLACENDELILQESGAPVDIILMRDPVDGTVFGRDIFENKVTPLAVVGRTVTVDRQIFYVEFRPILTMLVVNITNNFDEYASTMQWELDLEEI